MFFYLDKNELINGNAVVIFQVSTAIPNYKEIKNFGELVEFKGDNIPAQWEYSVKENTMYDIKDKPSPFHILKNKKWIVEDKEGFKTYCYEQIDKIKAEILAYGFEWRGHQQKCRDKDITYMAMTALIMFLVKTFLNKNITKKWYFEDNHFEEFDMTGLVQLMFTGSTFIQSVYDTENFFKMLPDPKLITKKDYLDKIKDYQDKAMGGE